MGDELLSYNLFAYCANNPVMGYDPYGNWDWNLAGKIALAAGSAIVSIGVSAAVGFFTKGGVTGAIANGVEAVVAIGISAFNGGLCAEASGGSFWDGFMAGTVGGSVSAAFGSVDILGWDLAGRAAGTMVSELFYAEFTTGRITAGNIVNATMNAGMDVLFSGMSYGIFNSEAYEGIEKIMIRSGNDFAIDLLQSFLMAN